MGCPAFSHATLVLSDRKGLQAQATTALGCRLEQLGLDLYVSARDTKSHPHPCAASLQKYSGEPAEKAAQVNLYTSPHRQARSSNTHTHTQLL